MKNLYLSDLNNYINGNFKNIQYDYSMLFFKLYNNDITKEEIEDNIINDLDED